MRVQHAYTVYHVLLVLIIDNVVAGMPSFLPGLGGSQDMRSKDSKPISWDHVISQFVLEVRCDQNTMTVLVHYATEYNKLTPAVAAMFESATAYLGEYNDSVAPLQCTAQKDRDEGSLVIRSPLDSCGIVMDSGPNNTMVYKGVLNIEPQAARLNLKTMIQDLVTVDVKCIHPMVLKQNAPVTDFSLLVYKETHPSVPLEERQQDVSVDENLWVDATATSRWYPQNRDISAFISECWLSKSPDDTDGYQRFRFFENGCLNKNSVLKVFKNKYSDHFKVMFKMEQDLLYPDSHRRENAEIMFVHCKLLACHNYTDIGIYNVPRCPRAGYCTGVPQYSHVLPNYLTSYQFTHAVSDAIIVNKRSSSPSSGLTLPVDCRIRCGRDNNAQQNTNGDQTMGNDLLVQPIQNGLSVTTTVLVSLCSFCMGALLMAGIWFVHVNTETHSANHQKCTPPGSGSGSSSGSSQSFPMVAPTNSLVANMATTASTSEHLTIRNNRNPYSNNDSGVHSNYANGHLTPSLRVQERPALLPQPTSCA